jgi:hypothetical protein
LEEPVKLIYLQIYDNFVDFARQPIPAASNRMPPGWGT